MATRNGGVPSVSVVVCTRDRPSQLGQCLAALSHLEYPDFEVVVVDNAPSDSRSREVAGRWDVRYLPEPTPGLSRARNRGAFSCGTEIVAYIDDDAVAEPHWLTSLVSDFEDPSVAAVTGSVLPLQPNSVKPVPGERAISSPSHRGQRRIIDRETPGWFEIANFGEMGDGLNMAFRRSVFDLWAGFDVRLGRGAVLDGGEEHYAFYALIESGYRMAYNPLAMVRHPDPQTTEDQRSRHLKVIATATAYMTFLAVEHPSCRRALARYVFDRLRNVNRPWMTRSGTAGSGVAPRWRSLLAMASGPWIYLRSKVAGVPRANASETLAPGTAADGVTGTALRDQHSHVES